MSNTKQIKPGNLAGAVIIFVAFVLLELHFLFSNPGSLNQVLRIILSGYIPPYIWRALIIALIGSAPLLWRKYLFSVIFATGYLTGLALNLLINYLEGPHQTMSGGIVHYFVIFLSIIAGVAAELVKQKIMRRNKPDQG